MLDNIKYVMINNQKYDIEGDTIESLNEIKEAALEIEPSLENADPVVEGDTVTFKYRAGTKGASIKRVVVGTEVYTVEEEDADPKDIQKALSEELHPELEDATYVISGDTMTFRFNAGTKGQ